MANLNLSVLGVNVHRVEKYPEGSVFRHCIRSLQLSQMYSGVHRQEGHSG